jgi:hypothetical protein
MELHSMKYVKHLHIINSICQEGRLEDLIRMVRTNTGFPDGNAIDLIIKTGRIEWVIFLCSEIFQKAPKHVVKVTVDAMKSLAVEHNQLNILRYLYDERPGKIDPVVHRCGVNTNIAIISYLHEVTSGPDRDNKWMNDMLCKYIGNGDLESVRHIINAYNYQFEANTLIDRLLTYAYELCFDTPTYLYVELALVFEFEDDDRMFAILADKFDVHMGVVWDIGSREGSELAILKLKN